MENSFSSKLLYLVVIVSRKGDRFLLLELHIVLSKYNFPFLEAILQETRNIFLFFFFFFFF